MDKIASKTFTSNLGKLSWLKSHNCLTGEFTAHYACNNAEMNLKSTTDNRFNFRIINSLMESWGVGLTWLDCNDFLRYMLLEPTGT